MWMVVLVGLGIVALAHTAPAPFVLDAMAGDRAVWHMPRGDPPTAYLTFDDGPNPSTTPDMLDVLAREGAQATFFLIDAHVTEETAPIIRRMFAEGHAVALHSATRRYMLLSPREFARTLTDAADHIERVAGARPCRAFRPHAGWRGGEMYAGLREIDYRLVGWGWMLWDWNWFRARTGILGLKDGGSSVLNKFITTYRREIARFAAPGLTNPVVVLYDSDSGAGSIRSTIREVSKLHVTGAEPFVHVVNNLYAVPTPLGGAKESQIEDFFDAAIKGAMIDGKTFNETNKSAADKHYGKTVFAHKVVRSNANTIDFSGFKPLLTNLVAAINAHKTPAVPQPPRP